METLVRCEVYYVHISETEAGQRIDNFLLRTLKGVPKSRIYRLLRRGEVRVNSSRVKASYRVRSGDQVRVPPVDVRPASLAQKPKIGAMARLEAAVIFENERLLVLNKPTGVAVHGGSGISHGVIELLRGARPDAPFLELGHRLDRETSGCLIIAKRRSVLRRLHHALRAHAVHKDYLCLVRDPWTERVRIDAPVRRDVERGSKRIVRVDPQGGREATTLFSPVDHWAANGWGGSLVRARLLTGRTHQIRVHAASAGHPLAGDDKYGDREFNKELRARGLTRLFLHAARLTLPESVTGERLEIMAPMPPDLEKFVQHLGLVVD